ncbi:MAG: V-type ATPase subunit [Gammaproteobacteria bacterium]|nr:V-type ATPase subunit [Gammaproteobacteria bacterium]
MSNPDYLNARITLFRSRMMGPETIERLISEPQPEYDLITQIEGIDEFMASAAASTAALEQAFTSQLMGEAQILMRPMTGPRRRFMRSVMHWFELANLKALIRGKLSGMSDAAIREHLVDTSPFNTLPIDELLRADDPAEMLRLLEGGPYGDIAIQARRIYEEKRDPFSLEATMDRRYFVGLHHRADEVERGERNALLQLVSCLIDRFNLLWLLRYRFGYGISAAETFYLLIPLGHLLNSATLAELARLGSMAEVLEALPPDLKPMFAGADTLTEVENRMEQRTRDTMKRAFERHRFITARVFAYVFLRDMELRQLLAVIKGRRLGFDPELMELAVSTGLH